MFTTGVTVLKLILSTILSFIAVSCATVVFYTSPAIDLELQPVLDHFLEEGASRGYLFDTSKIVMKIGDVPQFDPRPGVTTIGVCWNIYYDDKPFVLIDAKFWKAATYFSREAVVFHELGHCLLNREHNDKRMHANGESIPYSLMNSFAPKGLIYILNRQHYVDELFYGATNRLQLPQEMRN